MERKTRKHPSYSISDKNEVAKMYIKGEMSPNKRAEPHDVCKSVVKLWVNQYRMFGTAVDNRGRGSKLSKRQTRYIFETNTVGFGSGVRSLFVLDANSRFN